MSSSNAAMCARCGRCSSEDCSCIICREALCASCARRHPHTCSRCIHNPQDRWQDIAKTVKAIEAQRAPAKTVSEIVLYHPQKGERLLRGRTLWEFDGIEWRIVDGFDDEKTPVMGSRHMGS